MMNNYFILCYLSQFENKRFGELQLPRNLRLEHCARYTRYSTLLLVGVGKFHLKSGTGNEKVPLFLLLFLTGTNCFIYLKLWLTFVFSDRSEEFTVHQTAVQPGQIWGGGRSSRQWKSINFQVLLVFFMLFLWVIVIGLFFQRWGEYSPNFLICSRRGNSLEKSISLLNAKGLSIHYGVHLTSYSFASIKYNRVLWLLCSFSVGNVCFGYTWNCPPIPPQYFQFNIFFKYIFLFFQ